MRDRFSQCTTSIHVAAPDWTSANPFAHGHQAALESFLRALGTQAGPDVAAQMQSFASLSSRFGQLQSDLYRRHLTAWQGVLSGTPDSESTKDRRFASPEWGSSPYYEYLRRAYAINADFLSEVVEAVEMDETAKQKLRFAARQFIDAMSPANFAATNPEALKLALETKGESITRGIRNLLDDVQKGRISNTDESAFEVGRNLATTAGQVVFENELMQLIQYAPLAETAHQRPLVMVPPCINKFYILDLQPANSLVRHALEQGQQVFMVSWRNVDAATSSLGWDDYLDNGVLKSLEVASAITASPKVNVLGFCVGGTLVGSALAVLAARGEERVASLTLLAAMLDFAETGDISVFIDDATVAAREAAIGKGGVMPGRELALAFSSLRANDLVWPYVVNNYLKGQTPQPFDLLYWNADATNLPGPMYCYYVRKMYIENALKDPGRLTMLGVPVDLGRIDVPAYILATREDHIVPWQTAYRSVNLLGGKKRFVLGASGHIAGVINPVAKNRRSFWTNDATPADAGEWLAGGTENPGSWWSDWTSWLAQHSGRRVKAKKRLGNTEHRPIEPAPGRYVKEKA
jgi:polyhydroxyalkanoate synthase subunit PhaC